MCVTPLAWFLGKGAVLIDGVDTNFPLSPITWFLRRFFVWTDIFNAGSNFSSSTAGIFFHLIQVIPFSLGLGLKFTEIFSLVFWFAAIVISSFVLARVLTKNKLAQLTFVSLYVFNTYLFNTWENVKVSNLAVAVGLPAVLALLINVNLNKISIGKFVFFSTLISVLISGSGINPAYFVTIILVIVLYLLFHPKTIKRGSILLLIMFLVNIFWILPTVNFLIFGSKPVNSLSDIGYVNWIDDLSKKTSAFNVMRLQGAWDWYVFADSTREPEYLPYAANYLWNLPFVVFSVLIPLLAILSLAIQNRERKNLYRFFGTLFVLGIVLGIGTHTPTGFIYTFLAKHVPFFSFFRSPWYIFTPFATLSIAGLILLLSEYSLLKYVRPKKLLSFLFVLFVFGNLIYTYPLVTGKIFRPSRKDGFYIKFPPYVWSAKAWLTKRYKASDNRIISYPDDEIEKFKWGYRGVESILGLLSDVPLVGPNLVDSNSFVDAYLKEFYVSLRQGHFNSAFSMLPFFSADTLFVKNDADTSVPIVTFDGKDPRFEINNFGQWSFIVNKDLSQTGRRIFIPKRVYMNLSGNVSLAGASKFLKADTLVVDSNDSEVEKARASYGAPYLPVILEAKKESLAQSSSQRYSFEMPHRGIFNLAIEKGGFGDEEISVTLDGKLIKTTIEDTDESIIFKKVLINEGRHIVVVSVPVKTLLLRDNLNYQSSTLRKNALVFSMRDHFFDPYSDYVISFDYKYGSGNPPLFEAIQYTPSDLIGNSNIYLKKNGGFESQSFVVNTIDVPSKLDILITLPKESDPASISYFKNVRITKIFDSRVFIFEEAKEIEKVPALEYKRINPVKYEVTVEKGGEGYFLVFLDNFSKDWQLVSDDIFKIQGHFSSNGYANGWYVTGGRGSQKLTVYYRPQDIYVAGLVISALSIGSCIIVGVRLWRKYFS